MLNGKSFLAVIPARGGSKRLKKKNILEFAKKPLIAWSIEAGLKSKYIDRVIVSTEDKEIADISVKYGANVPFLRPKNLALDNSKIQDAIIHLINNLDEKYDFVVLLQPTSPLRDYKLVDESIEFLLSKGGYALVSVSEPLNHCQWAFPLDETFRIDKQIEDIRNSLNKRTQEFKKIYTINGAIFITKVDLFLKERSFYLKENIYAYVMNKIQGIDIDTLLDFKLAQLLFENIDMFKKDV